MGLADNDIPCDRACWNTALRLVLGAEAMSDSNLPLAKLIAEMRAVIAKCPETKRGWCDACAANAQWADKLEATLAEARTATIKEQITSGWVKTAWVLTDVLGELAGEGR